MCAILHAKMRAKFATPSIARRVPSGGTHAGMSLFSTPGKRTERLPTLRVTPSEKKAISWLVEKLSKEHGTSYGVSDVMRIALNRLYETEHGKNKDNAAASESRKSL